MYVQPTLTLKELHILPTECTYAFHMSLKISTNCVPDNINWLITVMKTEGSEVLNVIKKNLRL